MEDSQVGTEMRRLHIIYFLSRKGCVEHPHLIRVHHLSRNGIHLRDVKRWLAELRGKDMPESFAWSYKRRYKSGYVWQDLVDEDLITPISDNEYVLKGSEILSYFTSTRDENQDPMIEEAKNKSREEKQENLETPVLVLRNSSSEIEEELPFFGSETSTVTDDSTKLQENNQNNTEIKVEKYSSFSTAVYSTLLNKKNIIKKDIIIENENVENVENKKSNKVKNSSSGASQIFRNLITCGAVETRDSAIMNINRRKLATDQFGDHENIGGSQRIFGSSWKSSQKNDPSYRKSCDGVPDSTKFCSPRTSTSANYLPVNGPICSQCGKQFKPEKLHRHMTKSCKGMKGIVKDDDPPSVSATSADLTTQDSRESSHDQSSSGYYLTR